MIGGVQYIDGHKPVQTMKNRTKLAGWSLSEKTAAEPSWARTYNDKFSALTLTGATVQDGTPTPDAPIYPASAGGILRVNGASVAELPELNGIGGVGDTLDLLTGAGVQNISNVQYLHPDNILSLVTSNTNMDYISIAREAYPGIINPNTQDVVADKIITSVSLPRNSAAFNTADCHWRHWFYASSPYFVIAFPKSTYADLTAAKSAFSGMSYQYQLATPVPFTVAPLVVPTHYPQTAITQDNAVKASITASLKVAD